MREAGNPTVNRPPVFMFARSITDRSNMNHIHSHLYDVGLTLGHPDCAPIAADWLQH